MFILYGKSPKVGKLDEVLAPYNWVRNVRSFDYLRVLFVAVVRQQFVLGNNCLIFLCLFPNRMELYDFNRYQLGLVSRYLYTHHCTEEFITELANYVVS